MSWQRILQLIEDVVGPELAARIEARLVDEYRGLRIQVPGTTRPRPTDAQVHAALREARYNVADAAKALGVAPSSLYRRLNARLAKPKAPRLPLIR